MVTWKQLKDPIGAGLAISGIGLVVGTTTAIGINGLEHVLIAWQRLWPYFPPIFVTTVLVLTVIASRLGKWECWESDRRHN